MSAFHSNLAETKALLAGMAKEADELKQVLGGSITDTVAGWLAAQYVSAAQEKLGVAEGARRWEVLRAFVQDWTLLRQGDHTAERLQIERERLKLAKEDAEERQRTKVEAGLEQVAEEIKNSPKAKALFNPLQELLMVERQSGKEKEFREWLARPEIRKEIFPELTRGISPETLRKIEEELRLL